MKSTVCIKNYKMRPMLHERPALLAFGFWFPENITMSKNHASSRMFYQFCKTHKTTLALKKDRKQLHGKLYLKSQFEQIVLAWADTGKESEWGLALLMSLREIKTHVELEYSTQRNQAFLTLTKTVKPQKLKYFFKAHVFRKKLGYKLKHFEKNVKLFGVKT